MHSDCVSREIHGAVNALAQAHHGDWRMVSRLQFGMKENDRKRPQNQIQRNTRSLPMYPARERTDDVALTINRFVARSAIGGATSLAALTHRLRLAAARRRRPKKNGDATLKLEINEVENRTTETCENGLLAIAATRARRVPARRDGRAERQRAYARGNASAGR